MGTTAGVCRSVSCVIELEAVAMSRILVVANKTLGSSDLLQSIRDRMTKGPRQFTLLVPVIPNGYRENTLEALTRHMTHLPVSDEARGGEEADYQHATRRVEFGIEQLQKLGAEVDGGEVGNANPFKAVEDALSRHKYDEIILSTLPSRMGGWLSQDLPHKVRRKFKRPVTVVAVSR
jgi:GABA permease